MELTHKPELFRLDFDQLHRYGATALLLKPWIKSLGRSVRVLEVGCNTLDWLPDFLEPLPVEVTRCDVIDSGGGISNFVRIDRDRPLPFADGSFDFTVALEVLEHVPLSDRTFAVGEWLRVATHGLLFSCPNGVRAVRAAERRARRAYRQRHGRPHPWLEEHADYGLPSREEVDAILDRLGAPYRILDNSPLAEWLPLLLLTEELTETAGPEVVARFNEHFNRRPTPDSRDVPYRKLYLCFKDATEEQRARHVWGRRALPEATGDRAGTVVDPLAALAHSLGEVFARQGAELIQAEQLRELAEQRLHDARLELDFRGYGLAGRLSDWLGRLRWRWLCRSRSHGLESARLSQLRPCPSAGQRSWESVGDNPGFLLEQPVPAGLVRIGVRGLFPEGTVSKLWFDDGSGFRAENSIPIGPWHGPSEIIRAQHLERPVERWRFQPMDVPGRFAVFRFLIEPCSRFDLLRSGFTTHLKECWNPWWVLRKLGKLAALLWRDRGAIRGRVLARLTSPAVLPSGTASTYPQWLARHALTKRERRRLQRRLARGQKAPSLALVLRLGAVPEDALRRTLRSLSEQHYAHRELFLAATPDDAAALQTVWQQTAGTSEKIRLLPFAEPFSTGLVLNRVLALTGADYLVPLEAGDELAADALLEVAGALANRPDLDFLYTDEDELHPAEGRCRPHCKPDWSPEYYRAVPYTGRLAAYRVEACRGLGGFRPDLDEAAEHDLVLRLTASRGANVGHLPRMLYHRSASQHGIPTDAAANILAHHLAANTFGVGGKVEPGDPPRVRYALPEPRKVSIVIPTAGRWERIRGRPATFVGHCVAAIRRRSTHADYEILAIDNGDLAPEVIAELVDHGVRRLTFTGAFNLANKLNWGARHATGDYLLFLNDDVEVLTSDWMEGLLEYAGQPGVGAAGARLLFPDGRLQHAGIVVLPAGPAHPFYGYPGEHEGYFRSTVTPRNCLAVTGACLMTPRPLFEQLGGFDPRFAVNYNDVDYCLRLHEHGCRIVFTPHVQLLHFEGVSRDGGATVQPGEKKLFRQRWGRRLARDPYWNDNLSTEHLDYRLAGSKRGRDP
jgi:glycosyltransferase involved in cell wall biosynthesis